MVSRIRAAALASAAVVAVALTAQPTSAPAQDSVSVGGWSQNTTSGGSGPMNGCTVVANPAFLGFSCGGHGSGSVNVRKVLSNWPGPSACWGEREKPSWDVPLTEVELKAVGQENSDETTWYWHYYVSSGIDQEANIFAPKIETSLKAVHPPEQPCTLTSSLATYLRPYGAYTSVMRPIVATSPAGHPRVNSWVSFFNANGQDHVEVNDHRVPDVTLVADLVSTKVYPYGQTGGHTFTCEGGGYQAKKGEGPRDVPNSEGGCWFKYERSSDDQFTGDRYEGRFAAKMETHWDVRLVTDEGTFTTLDGSGEGLEFDKPGVSRLQVTQVEAVVVR